MKILLNGARGRMGQAIQELAPELGVVICLALDRGDALCTAQLAEVDIAIDFSQHEATLPLVQAAQAVGKPVLIGTTGHSAEARAAITKASTNIPIMWAGNYSVGITLLIHYTEQLARQLGPDYHPEVIEMHHHRKVDAPSGTAENLVAALLRGRNWPGKAVRHGRSGITGQRPDQEIGVHAIRGGEIVGEHTVLFAGTGERLELTHRAADRRIFAEGALRAARWLLPQKPGIYDMRDVLGLR
jgi:4-hydroxy-tetrahydrodipicolinate reductase